MRYACASLSNAITVAMRDNNNNDNAKSNNSDEKKNEKSFCNEIEPKHLVCNENRDEVRAQFIYKELLVAPVSFRCYTNSTYMECFFIYFFPVFAFVQVC